MTFQEKRSIVHIISSILIFGGYFIYIFQRHQNGILDPTDFRFWGKSILILIPVQIAVTIVLHIIFSIINTIATKEKEPKITDERDKIIELKSSRNAYYVYMIGFLLAMGALALNMQITVMFIVLVSAQFMAQIAWNTTQFFFYRKGY